MFLYTILHTTHVFSRTSPVAASVNEHVDHQIGYTTLLKDGNKHSDFLTYLTSNLSLYQNIGNISKIPNNHMETSKS